MSLTGEEWYVVQTQPNAENRAICNLGRQGFKTYLPRYMKRRRHARKTEIVAAPLFPRYVFVAIDIATRQWRSIQSTFGVSRLVCNGDRPAAISSWVIDQLRGREDSSGYVQLRPMARFAHGEKVRIVEGVFSECLGLFEDMTDRERVIVLLDLLGRKVRVVLDGSAVAAA